MIGTAFQAYKTVDPAEKNAKWWNDCVTILRRDWRPLVNLNNTRINKLYLLSEQPLDKIKKSFKDKKFKELVNFQPIGIMNNILNTITEDMMKMPPKAEVKATDPSAISDRKKDLEMLKSRKVIQGDISKYNKQIGLPPYKLPYDKFKGNVEQFDKMGLDESEPDDLGFYELNYQRLNYETAAQQIANNVVKLNRFDEDMTKKYVIDILADNVVCSQAYVNKITGEIKYRYIYPETYYGIFNDSNDGHNDICNGWQDTKTLGEFLAMIGNEFDWERDWTKVLWAINFAANTKFTGFNRSGVVIDCCGNQNLSRDAGIENGWSSNILDWSLAYTYKVSCGYIEAKSLEATSTTRYKIDINDPYKKSFSGFVTYDDQLEAKITEDGYQQVSNYQEQMYGSYFLTTSSVSQWEFGFGKIYYTQLEGANDEYCSGTMKYFLNEGLSPIELVKTFIDFVNFTYYKILWLVWHAKPEEDQVVLEELVSISKGLQRMYPQMANNKVVPSVDNILTQLIEYQRENFVRVRAFPQIDGKTIGQLPQLEGKRNGVDHLSVEMLSFFQWAEGEINKIIGFNSMRSGGNPQSRESYKSEQATLQASYNSTGFIYRTISFLKNRLVTTTLNYAQDIIKFKDTIPYKWLKQLIGNEMFASLDLLDDFSAHRFGIFVGDYNSNIDKQMILQAANFALQEKTLTFDQWFCITQTEDYKLAAKILSYQLLKADKRKRKQEIQNMQIQDQMNQKQFERQLTLIQEQGKIDLEGKNIAKKATEDAAQINTDGRVEVKRMTIESEPAKQIAKSEGGKELAATKENLKQQEPFPNSR